MITPDQQELINKLYDGNCTEEDLDRLFQIVKTLPKEEATRVMEELWKQAKKYPKLQPKLSDKMYANVLSRIAKKQSRAAVRETKMAFLSSNGRRLFQMISVAAVFLALGAVFSLLWINNKYRTVSTAFREQQTITLPDGSSVKLNANSTLRFKKRWIRKEIRQVWLEGEAFFEVSGKIQPKQKFQVITPDLTVEVLGTVFNVNSHRKKTKVFLEEGRIALRFRGQPEEKARILKPGELLTYSSQKKEILEFNPNTATKFHTSWTDGALIFDNTPLIEVLHTIEENYGIRFYVQNEANNQRKIKGGLPMEELEIAIDMLEQLLMDLEIKEEKGLYIVQ